MNNSLDNESRDFQELRTDRQRLKIEHDGLFQRLSEILFQNDPMEISYTDNTNEYEPEVGTIIPRLPNCKSSLDVLNVVHEELSRWFGSDEAGQKSEYSTIANEIWEAWQNYRLSDEGKESRWDPKAFAERMRKSNFPVSAFFLIDSMEAFSRCVQWLSLLEPFGMPRIEDSKYFNDIREIYKTGSVVINFDFTFVLHWQNNESQGMLRYHFIDKGRYEIELWLPGVIADELADKFRDGHEGFFCAFMPPQFYD